jgi:Ca2+-binding RTX toxin-like protein
VTRFRVHLRDGNDTGAGYLRYVMRIPMTVDGASGDDRVLGGYGGDYLVGGPGHDTFSASNGDDTIDAQDGEPDSGSCGAGTDTVYVDPSGDDFATAGDCEVITTTPAPPPP